MECPAVDLRPGKLRSWLELEPEELSGFAQILQRTQRRARRSDLILEGSNPQDCFLLVDGWACSYRLLNDGRRQIIHLYLPGDLVGVRSAFLDVAEFSVSTITRTSLKPISVGQLAVAMRHSPPLYAALARALAREGAIIGEHLVSAGRRSAQERMAHLVLELHERLSGIGLSVDGAFAFPMTQMELADALGLSLIHTNRTWRELRQQGLVDLAHGQLRILSRPALSKLCGFSATYLLPPGRQPDPAD